MAIALEASPQQVCSDCQGGLVARIVLVPKWLIYSVPLTALYPLLTVLLAVGFLGEKLKPL
jgi:hypothetical protein